MVELWYGITSVMLAAYVVMDGFDLGAGAVHCLVARTNEERRQTLAAIGPFWDGNEVWLLASGGALFVAFPKVLAVGVSGFYLAIFLVLWTLILRGLAIEFRSHVNDALWRAAWDFIFSLASTLLAVFFGAALGNLIRGVPLDQNGWFALPLFTDFSGRNPVGILDWYTVLVGLFAWAALAAHGAVFLTWKTNGAVGTRSHALGSRLYFATAILWVAATLATIYVNPEIFQALTRRPLAWFCLLVAVLGAVQVFFGLARGAHLRAFVGSSCFLAAVLAATATCFFPTMLRATTDPALTVTAYAAASDPQGLRTALGWWVVGFPLAILYFVINFRLHRGKATAAAEGHGY